MTVSLNDAAIGITLDTLKDADWTARRFYHEGDPFFRDTVQAVREARQSIRVETYIFHLDRLTRVLLDELGRARTRGCQVQLLIDGFGSLYWLESIADECRRREIELRVWEPLPRRLSSLRRLLVPLQFRIARVLRKLNRRDHRKVTIIDDRAAFVGSFNLSSVHSEEIMGANAWRDSGAYVEGESVRDLVGAFDMAWARARRTSFRRFFTRRIRGWRYDPRRSRVRLNASPRDRRFINRDLVRRLRRATGSVRLVSAYFMPTRSVLNALRGAARRGVRIEIITPGPSDVPLVKWAGAGVMKALLRSGAKLFEYQKTILHAKYYLIDGWATVGSTNLNHRSLFHDLEAEAVFEDADSLGKLQAQFAIDLANSREITLETLRRRPLYLRLLSSIAFRLRYVL